jgi:hypothetical protein
MTPFCGGETAERHWSFISTLVIAYDLAVRGQAGPLVLTTRRSDARRPLTEATGLASLRLLFTCAPSSARPGKAH